MNATQLPAEAQELTDPNSRRLWRRAEAAVQRMSALLDPAGLPLHIAPEMTPWA